MIAAAILVAALSLLIVVFFPLALVPIFVDFLPSRDWASRNDHSGNLLGAAAALAATALIIYSVARGKKPRDRLSFSGIATAAIMIFVAFEDARGWVLVGIPAVNAIFHGSDTQIDFLVSSASPFGSSRCRPEVVMIDLPVPFDRLCGWPRSFVSSLHPSERVTAYGFGTPMGLFVRRLEPR